MDTTKSTNIGNAAIVLITVLMGYLYIRGTVDDSRPAPLEAATVANEQSPLNRVESRLWQDPFYAVESIDAHHTNEMATLAGGTTLQDSISLESNVTTSIIAVLLEGGSFKENSENRQRARYAVELAMLNGGYSPEDRTHLSVVLWPANPANPSASRKKLAFEKFHGSDREACILWINENSLTSRPKDWLETLCTNFPDLTNSRASSTLYLIGPRASDTLAQLCSTNDEYSQCITALKAAQTGHLQILSPEATGSLGAGVNYTKKCFKTIFGTNVFHNWIAQDRDLAILLAEELDTRISWTSKDPNNVIAIISEQDTFFGRHLAEDWRTAFTNRTDLNIREENIWQFDYLRGLDGSTLRKPKPPEHEPPFDSPAQEALNLRLQQKVGKEVAGNAQLDYIFRLGQELQRRDQDMKNAGKGRIIGVGLTGSDVYDKLEILSVLRRLIPEAVFFTHDLDAPLWNSSQQQYSRNLLVASAYPLSPSVNNSLSQWRQPPPFRDVYQTAIYRACYAVANQQTNIQGRLYEPDPADLRGGLYSIGRHGPVRLDAQNANSGCAHFSAATSPQEGSISFAWLGVAVLLAFMIVWFLGTPLGGTRLSRKNIDNYVEAETGASTEIKKMIENENGRRVPKMGLLTGFIILLVIWFICRYFYNYTTFIAAQPGEEPWDLTGGVSIWASEWIRLILVLASLLFLKIAFGRHKKHGRELWRYYFCEFDRGDSVAVWRDYLKARKESSPAVGFVQSKWVRFFSVAEWTITGWMPDYISSDRAAELKVNAALLFRRYLKLGQFKFRLLRIICGASVYLLTLGLLMRCMRAFPLFMQIRGLRSHSLDFMLLTLSIVAFASVLFYVIDTALLSARLLECISRLPTNWPARVLDEQMKVRGVYAEHLDGFLDVNFAAFQTRELAPLMLIPVLVWLGLVIARNPLFDYWTWPVGLLIVFVVNFLASAVCWWIVRQYAAKVRTVSLARLDENLNEIKMADKPYGGVPVQVYVSRLENMRTSIVNEKRGAYAIWFQDPTYLSIFIPSGVTGILSIFATLLIKR